MAETEHIKAAGRGVAHMAIPSLEAGPIALMAAILAGSENLAGAACTTDPAAHDKERWAGETRSESLRLADAVEHCQRCPARQRCLTWASRQPRGRITGFTPAHPVPQRLGKYRPTH